MSGRRRGGRENNSTNRGHGKRKINAVAADANIGDELASESAESHGEEPDDRGADPDTDDRCDAHPESEVDDATDNVLNSPSALSVTPPSATAKPIQSLSAAHRGAQPVC